MLNIRLSVLALTLIGFTVTVLSGCSSTPSDPTAAWAPEKYTAKHAMNRVRVLGIVRPCCSKTRGTGCRYAFGTAGPNRKSLCTISRLRKIQAIATLDRFLKLHPASPGVDYALYLKGLVNFNDNLGLFSFITRQDLSERDQKPPRTLSNLSKS